MRILRFATLYDHRTFYWVQQQKYQQQLIKIARKVSWTADGYFYLMAGLLLLLTSQYLILKVVAIGLLMERAIYFVIKKNAKRNRPPEKFPGFVSVVKAADQFSFPSGHTSAAFFFATLFCVFSPVCAYVLFPWACCVGISRVILGVHFPTDTVAGAVLGTGIALLNVAMWC